MQPTTGATSPFRWAGSKRQLVPDLLARAPTAFRTYREPFAGSASLYFALAPRHAVLSDTNVELMNAFRQIKCSPSRLSAQLRRLPPPSDGYFRVRNLDPNRLTLLRRAARFIYLNRFAFNGVYRTNARGQFNVPPGRRTGHLPTLEDLHAVSASLAHTRLLTVDFSRALALAGRDDFVYADPPYTVGPRHRGEYGCPQFDAGALSRLAADLRAASRRGALILLSYSPTPRLKELLPGWHSTEVQVRRIVASRPDKRGPAPELLLSNSQDLIGKR